jgi:hypothetical protein
LNTPENAGGFFSAKGRTLVIELTDRDASPLTTDVIADALKQTEHAQELKGMGFDRIEVLRQDESENAVRLIR